MPHENRIDKILNESNNNKPMKKCKQNCLQNRRTCMETKISHHSYCNQTELCANANEFNAKKSRYSHFEFYRVNCEYRNCRCAK